MSLSAASVARDPSRISLSGTEITPPLAQLIGSFRQRRPASHLVDVGLAAAEQLGKGFQRPSLLPAAIRCLYRYMLLAAGGLGQLLVVLTPLGVVLRPVEQRILMPRYSLPPPVRSSANWRSALSEATDGSTVMG